MSGQEFSMIMRRLTFWFVLLLLLATSSHSVRAFEEDFHHDWTFYLALSECFDWEEANLIASGNQRQDDPERKAKALFYTERNFLWHAFGDPRDVKKREDELWQRVLDEKDPKIQLIKLGQLLHFVQDAVSHNGYEASTGHAINGFRSDSMGDGARVYYATNRTLYYLRKKLIHLRRKPKAVDFYNMLQPTLQEMIHQSEPGLFGNSGQDKNRKTIEKAIQQYVSDKVPSFVSKSPDGSPSIPPIVDVEYDEKNQFEPVRIKSGLVKSFETVRVMNAGYIYSGPSSVELKVILYNPGAEESGTVNVKAIAGSLNLRQSKISDSTVNEVTVNLRPREVKTVILKLNLVGQPKDLLFEVTGQRVKGEAFWQLPFRVAQ